ncbi:MAG: UDP-3-O-acyl-N-acetylglucosamine deacetylase [Betaproteobacteria bacterium]|nr:MAG: UDP-3-O-acyl-N-acetylglucosamine deacetylase [Betaproteobacteria bacterium]
MISQHTLRKAVSTRGVGLHGGRRVTLTLRPAPVDTGIVFRRVDLPQAPGFRVDPQCVMDTRMCSALERDGAKVSTVEHLMSALAGLAIDNLYCDLDGPEVPIMDGSAAPFVYLIEGVGLEAQSALRRYVRVLKTVRVEDGDKWAAFYPCDCFRLKFHIDFDHPALQKSGDSVQMDFSRQAFVQDISRARTFGFMRDVEYLRAHGLALGGTLDNAIVMDDFSVLNADGLRYSDEFVKHKVLDAIGDLYLVGHPLLAELDAYKSGHGLNNKLLRALMDDASAWEWASFPHRETAPEAIRLGTPPSD